MSTQTRMIPSPWKIVMHDTLCGVLLLFSISFWGTAVWFMLSGDWAAAGVTAVLSLLLSGLTYPLCRRKVNQVSALFQTGPRLQATIHTSNFLYGKFGGLILGYSFEYAGQNVSQAIKIPANARTPLLEKLVGDTIDVVLDPSNPETHFVIDLLV